MGYFCTRRRTPVWLTISFLHGLLMSTCSGTLYLYSAYANNFKTHLSFNQTEVNLISSVGDNGLYLCSLPLAYLLDKTSPGTVSAVASGLGGVGYTVMALVYAQVLPVSPGLMGTGFFLVGLASSGGYSSALATNVVNFSPKSRGSVVGVIVGGFGLSAFVFAQIYNAGYGPHRVTSFFVMLAVVLASVFACGVVLLRKLPYSPPTDPENENGDPDALPGGYVSVSSRGAMERKNFDIDRVDHQSPSPAPRGPDGNVPSRVVAVNTPLLSGSANEDLVADVPELLHEIHGWGLATSIEFWLLYGVLVAGLGCGLMYINNLSSILVSIAAGAESKSSLSSKTSVLVGALSVANCAGRVIFGSSSDAIVPRVGVPHASFLVVAMALMALAQGLNAFLYLSLSSVWATTILTGLAYGGLFAIGPTCVSRFSLIFFATNWSIASTSAGIGGNALSTVFGLIYDAHQPSGSDKCFGHACYQSAFYISFAVSLLGLLLASILTFRRYREIPKPYQ